MKKFSDYLKDAEVVSESKIFTEDDWDKFNQMAIDGKIKDIDNPIFVFSTTKTSLLKDLINGKYNVQDLMELEYRKNR